MSARLIAGSFLAVFCLSGESWSGSSAVKCPINPEYRFYDVYGNSPAEARASMIERGPKDAAGKPRFAYTDWHVSWRWKRTPDGDVDTNTIKLECSAEILLPRLRPASNASQDFLRSWHEYIERAREHELKHVEHVSAKAPEIRSTIRHERLRRGGLSPMLANDIASGVINRIRALDRAYDRATNHGLTEGLWIVSPLRGNLAPDARDGA
jgi:predicted secreted Zn-dependent protease